MGCFIQTKLFITMPKNVQQTETQMTTKATNRNENSFKENRNYEKWLKTYSLTKMLFVSHETRIIQTPTFLPSTGIASIVYIVVCLLVIISHILTHLSPSRCDWHVSVFVVAMAGSALASRNPNVTHLRGNETSKLDGGVACPTTQWKSSR